MIGRLSVRYLSALLIKTVLSVGCAGVVYFAWLGLFLLVRDSIGSLVTGVLSVAAPVATAIGLATGIIAHEHVTQARKATFLSVLVWPLAGCAVGAVAIYWRGPMLIVLGMFVLGAASVILRELVLPAKEYKNRDGT